MDFGIIQSIGIYFEPLWDSGIIKHQRSSAVATERTFTLGKHHQLRAPFFP